ncbi:MAG: AEC family transporter [Lachnospiraceae bacterium]|nr:AEC family transporter [Lachnospiraceae bacterium]
MENLLLSLNIVCPVFLLIALGWFLKKRGIMTAEFCSKATTLVFYWALPASLMKQVADSDIADIFSLKFTVYAVLSVIGVFAAAWILAETLLRDKSQVSASVHGAFRSNFAYVGLPIISMITGNETLTAAIMIITFVLPMYNILAIPMFNHYNAGGKQMTVKQQLISIIKNPMIIGVLLGLPFSLFHLPMPVILGTTLTNLGRIASPLGLLLIGATLRMDALSRKWQGIVLSSVIKVLISPVVCTLLAIPLRFSMEELATIYVLHAVPSAVNSYIMTAKMGGDEETGAGIVMLTSLVSVVTMTLGIFLLKQLGLI